MNNTQQNAFNRCRGLTFSGFVASAPTTKHPNGFLFLKNFDPELVFTYSSGGM